MKYFYLTIIAIFVLFSSCTSSSSNEINQGKAEAIKIETKTYVSLSQEQFNDLYSRTNAVDVLFNDLPISMSMDTEDSAKKFYSYIEPKAATINKKCQPIGQILMKSDGELIAEFNFYFQDGCMAFVLTKDRKEIAGNRLSKTGYKFFSKTFNSLKGNK